ncbi:MAG: ABC transporter permease [Thermotoga sp.]|nr:MAG: ABC transporter permease [Thermotoga sp.]HDM70895.1 ABC transporter permease [Thermotogales bacterium]
MRKIFTHYLFKRFLRMIFVIYVVVTFTFFLIRFMPSNPVEIYIENLMSNYSMSYEDARNMASSLFSIDLDTPLWKQYLIYLKNLLRGDLGKSILSSNIPVAEMISGFIPWTIFSVGASLIISFFLGISLGMMMAYRRGGILDHCMTTFASIVSAIPSYLIGLLLIVLLGVQLKIVPLSYMRGSISPGVKPGFNLKFFLDALAHAAVPITTYVISTVGGWMLSMKGNTLNVLGEDYITVARARGLKDRTITFKYVGKNAMLPLMTSLAISIGFIFGGSVIIENIFVYKGMGWLLAQSINSRDYTVMQGVFLIITVSVVLANFIAELLYVKLDPRIRR